MGTLEDEVKAILNAARDKGIEAAGGEAPIPDMNMDAPEAVYLLPALMTNERTWAALLPMIRGIEDALVRIARELDTRGGA